MILLHILWPTSAIMLLIFVVRKTLAVRRMAHVKTTPPRREEFASDAAYRRYFQLVEAADRNFVDFASAAVAYNHALTLAAQP